MKCADVKYIRFEFVFATVWKKMIVIERPKQLGPNLAPKLTGALLRVATGSYCTVLGLIT